MSHTTICEGTVTSLGKRLGFITGREDGVLYAFRPVNCCRGSTVDVGSRVEFVAVMVPTPTATRIKVV